MNDNCICCQKTLTSRKECFEVANSVSGRFICKECALELGIKNFFSAGLHSKANLLKKYVSLHPEKQELLDKHNEEMEVFKNEKKAELVELLNKPKEKKLEKAREKELEKLRKKSKLKEKIETQYTCSKCGEVWYFTTFEALKGFVYAGSVHIKDSSACPKCGSGASTRKIVKYWVDKDGNCVDFEE